MHPPVTSSQLGIDAACKDMPLSTRISSTLTEADLALRVDRFLEVSIASLDASALRRISALIHMGWSTTQSHQMLAPVVIEDTASIDAVRWFLHEFRDLDIHCRLRLKVDVEAPHAEVKKRQALIYDTLGIATYLPTPMKYAYAGENKTIVDAALEIQCADLVIVYRRFKSQLLFHANRYFGGTSTARLPHKRKIPLFLSEHIFNAQLSTASSTEVAAVSRQAEREEWGDATATPAHVWDALYNRVAQVRRRCGAPPQTITLEQIDGAYRQMAQALEKGDPLEIAAVAVVLYDMDRSCRLPVPAKLVTDRYKQQADAAALRGH